MATLVYEYDKCSTCKNALKWLEQNKIPFKKIPIVEQPPKLTELKEYVERSGLPLTKFFNTSGLVYREMELGKKLPSMSEAEMLKLLATNGKLIKRPLVVDGKEVLIGFKESQYTEHFKK